MPKVLQIRILKMSTKRLGNDRQRQAGRVGQAIYASSTDVVGTGKFKRIQLLLNRDMYSDIPSSSKQPYTIQAFTLLGYCSCGGPVCLPHAIFPTQSTFRCKTVGLL